jgi:hypothetical protein
MIKAKWFFVQWGEGNDYPNPDLGESISEFTKKENIEADDVIELKYETSINGFFESYTALLLYKAK